VTGDFFFKRLKQSSLCTFLLNGMYSFARPLFPWMIERTIIEISEFWPISNIIYRIHLPFFKRAVRNSDCIELNAGMSD
jgi:hypothetical protein